MGLLANAWSALKSAASSLANGVRKGRAPRGPDPRMYLAGAAPGMWSSSHLAEAARCEGWQFVAVRAKATMAAQAELSVVEVGSPREKAKRIKRAMRWCRAVGDRAEFRRYKAQLKRLRSSRPRFKQSSASESSRMGAPRGAKSDDPRATGDPRDGREPAHADHPLLRLMQRPNPEWSLPTLLFAAVQQLSLTGTCYLWRVRDPLAKQPAELYVLPTGLLQNRMPTAAYPKGSYYLTPLSAWGMQNPNSEWEEGGTLGQALLLGAEIDARDVKAIRWPHPLYLSDGLSPLHAIRLWVDVSNEMDRASWYAMQNTERPGLIVKQVDSKVQPEEADLIRFREDLRSDHTGTPNTGKHLVVPLGFDAEPRSSTPAEMDWTNSRPQYRDMNLAAHRVSPTACGISEAGSYAQYWAAIKQTTDLAVQPDLSLIAGELTELLGGEFDGPRCEIVLAARRIDDPQIKLQELAAVENRLKTDIAAGNVLKVDEYRDIRGLAPLGGELGEAFVGVKTTVRQQDGDPEKPGVQGEGNKPGDEAGDEDGTGSRQEFRDRPPGRQDGEGKSRRKGEWNEGDHPRRDDGKFGEGAGDSAGSDSGSGDKPGKEKPKKPAKEKPDKEKPDKPKKPAAKRGEMASASRQGEGKEARVVLEGGETAPDHITPAMVGADWTEVQVSLDADADVLVTGRDKKGNAKTVYSARWDAGQAADKFTRTYEGLAQAREMHAQNQKNRADDKLKEHADCTWLMMEQGTRPGSEKDNKGVSKLFGQKIAAKDVVIERGTDKKGKPTLSVSLKVKDETVPVKDKKAKAELIRRVEHHEPLHDSTYWLKSHGATTLEGRHVIEKDGGVYLEFMGKESVWHSHKVKSHDLADMLVERKKAAGDTGKLFGTNEAKVGKYAKTLDGGAFTPKDWRTQKATALAIEEIDRMEAPETEKARKAAILSVGEKVSRVLGNEPKQALGTYIAPEVFSVWEVKL